MDKNKDVSYLPSSKQRGAYLIVNRQILPLLREITTLGRDLANDVVIHEDFVSRFHAEIVLEKGKYVVYDKKSTGGIYLNGKKIDRHILNSGDLISLVNMQIMFVDNKSILVDKSIGLTQNLGGLHNE